MPPLMRSELPEIGRTRHHWIVLFRAPSWAAVIGLLALLVWSLFYPAMGVVLVLVLVAAMFFRWQTWRAEQIILTRQRIIRVRGVPETTTTEAFLRVDRVSGMRIVQSVPGKMLNYATIELEAPGNHPDVRHLVKIWHPHEFYRALRLLIFAEGRADGDPDDVGSRADPVVEFATTPLPRITPPNPPPPPAPGRR